MFKLELTSVDMSGSVVSSFSARTGTYAGGEVC